LGFLEQGFSNLIWVVRVRRRSRLFLGIVGILEQELDFKWNGKTHQDSHFLDLLRVSSIHQNKTQESESFFVNSLKSFQRV
jgi:hypothetical protein